MRPTLLIDGNNVLVRAVEATRRTAMLSPTGVSTAAFVVFARTVARHIRAEQPFRVSVLWDAGADARTALYPPYKANRPQAPDVYRSHSRALAREWLTLNHLPQAHADGVEADDLIAAYWRTATAPVLILSNDKDMLQLVGETPTGHSCTQIRLSSADTPTDRWDTARVVEHFGCTPEQLPIAMSLAGDSADNIPGVPGIGMIKAVKHLAAAGWDLDQVTYESIVQHRPQVDIYRQLVDLRDISLTPPTLPPFMPPTPGTGGDWAALAAFLNRHGLRDLANRSGSGELW